jgi:hypothetical protein
MSTMLCSNATVDLINIRTLLHCAFNVFFGGGGAQLDCSLFEMPAILGWNATVDRVNIRTLEATLCLMSFEGRNGIVRMFEMSTILCSNAKVDDVNNRIFQPLSWLPDGIFSNHRIPIRVNLGGSCNGRCRFIF